MKKKWLNKNNNEQLIVFFNGWGMDEKIVSHLDFENYDVLMFYDYRGFDNIGEDFSIYKKKYLTAWSMGVKVSCFYADIFDNFDVKIAINGTTQAVDDNYGIPEFAYNLMINNFNENTKEKFIKKITVKEGEYCIRSIAELKEELIQLRDLKPERLINFDKVTVSLKDRIIPAKNQLNYWIKEGIKPIEKDWYHSIFDLYTKWSELL